MSQSTWKMETPTRAELRAEIQRRVGYRLNNTAQWLNVSKMQLKRLQCPPNMSKNQFTGASIHIANIPSAENRTRAGIARVEGAEFSLTHAEKMVCYFRNIRTGFDFTNWIQNHKDPVYVESAVVQSRREHYTRIRTWKGKTRLHQEPWMQRSNNGLEYR